MELSSEIYQIFDSYINNVKPLLKGIKDKRKKLPDNLMNEIRALNDHIARCYRDDNGDISVEITKAKGHLNRLQLDCFKELDIIFHTEFDRYERLTYSSVWLRIDGGDFWQSYSQKRQESYTAVYEAKLNETLNVNDSLRQYEIAYQDNIELDKLFKKHKNKLIRSFFVKTFELINSTVGWIIITTVLSVIAAIIQVLMV